MNVDIFAARFDAVVANVERVVHGKHEAIELAVTCMFAGGHLLIEDPPGVGKTSLARSLADSIDVTMKRLQCTPDLLPTDITGTPVYQPRTGELRFREGPVFANVVLADEVNRATPRAQSALLEAMEERQVTVDGETHRLPAPFLVLATQNPIDAEGTYPLPEAQLDRFLMRIRLGYPDEAAERAILEDKIDHGGRDRSTDDHDGVSPVLSGDDVNGLTRIARRIRVADTVHDYILKITRATRLLVADRRPGSDTRTDRHADIGRPGRTGRSGPATHAAVAQSLAGNLTLGASPRASVGLLQAAQVWAAADGRNHVRPEHVKDLAVPVIAHRLLLSPAATLAGLDAETIVKSVVDSIPVPR